MLRACCCCSFFKNSLLVLILTQLQCLPCHLVTHGVFTGRSAVRKTRPVISTVVSLPPNGPIIRLVRTARVSVVLSCTTFCSCITCRWEGAKQTTAHQSALLAYQRPTQKHERAGRKCQQQLVLVRCLCRYGSQWKDRGCLSNRGGACRALAVHLFCTHYDPFNKFKSDLILEFFPKQRWSAHLKINIKRSEQQHNKKKSLICITVSFNSILNIVLQCLFLFVYI